MEINELITKDLIKMKQIPDNTVKHQMSKFYGRFNAGGAFEIKKNYQLQQFSCNFIKICKVHTKHYIDKKGHMLQNSVNSLKRSEQ